MPELPEVETVTQTLKNSFFINSVITEIKILKGRTFSNVESEEVNTKLKGQRINDIIRKGKWIIIYLTNFVLICHLRLTGNFFLNQIDFPSIIFFLEGDKKVFFHDYRGFGRIYLQTLQEYKSSSPFKNIGIDAISEEFTKEYLFSFIKTIKRKLNIKTLLLDQTIVSGIGNIYASEILFAAKIHPLTLAKALTDKDINNIVNYTKKILKESINCGGTSIINWVSPTGKKGVYQEKLKVYNREGQPCFFCQQRITSFKIGGRTTFVCQQCQILSN